MSEVSTRESVAEGGALSIVVVVGDDDAGVSVRNAQMGMSQPGMLSRRPSA